MRRLAALLVLPLFSSLALPAHADNEPTAIPDKGDASITILGGWRAAPQHDFLSEQQRDGLNPSHNLFQPGGVLSLGFAADRDFLVTIDVGYGIDSYSLKTGSASVSIVNILLGADTPIFVTPYFTLYGGGGLGYSLNTFSYQSASQESNSSAGFLRVGARFRLTHRIALVVEDRYVVSSALWPALNSNFNVGGNMLSVGLMFHFFSPEDAGHPVDPAFH